MKKRLREGAKLIVVDPRRIDIVRTPHVEAAYHLPLTPGTNVAVLTAMAHVIVTEGLVNEAFVKARCDMDAFKEWAAFVAEARHSPEAVAAVHRRRAGRHLRAAARLYATGGNARDLLRPRRHRAQPGLDHGAGDRQPGDGHRQSRPAGRRRQPAARPEQRAGRVRHGLVPARAVRLSSRLGRRHAGDVRGAVGPAAEPRARPAHPEHARRRGRRHVQGALHPGRGHPAVRSRHAARVSAGWRRWNAWSSTTCS